MAWCQLLWSNTLAPGLSEQALLSNTPPGLPPGLPFVLALPQGGGAGRSVGLPNAALLRALCQFLIGFQTEIGPEITTP